MSAGQRGRRRRRGRGRDGGRHHHHHPIPVGARSGLSFEEGARNLLLS